VAHDPPDFAQRPVIAVLRGQGQHPAWVVRLARAAHQIAVDSLDPPAPPPGKGYQLWLAASGAAAKEPLGLMPLSGRKIIAETPETIRALARKGELWVTLEPASGTLAAAPTGRPMFRGNFGASN
jgi:anti-sigma-K factor RskA